MSAESDADFNPVKIFLSFFRVSNSMKPMPWNPSIHSERDAIASALELPLCWLADGFERRACAGVVYIRVYIYSEAITRRPFIFFSLLERRGKPIFETVSEILFRLFWQCRRRRRVGKFFFGQPIARARGFLYYWYNMGYSL